MNDMPVYIAASIGVLLIILGFAALLTQKIYLDSETQSPIEFDLPILGKMKANYPALAFVFLGCALAVYGVNQHQALREVPWQVDGTITTGNQEVNWQEGQLAVIPSKVDTEIDPQTGKFKIKLEIEEGKTLEDVVERIDYSHHDGSVIIVPKKEFELYQKHESSMLSNVTNTTLMSAFTRRRRMNPWLACKHLFQALPGMAGGAVVETTVDHTLMRGSEPHDR